MTRITGIQAREVLDSRGEPTVEVDVYLASGVMGRAAVPSGASASENGAVELRDGDSSRYLGRGVTQAVVNVNEVIAQELLGMDALNQREIDHTLCMLDGTKNKSRLGANAVLGVSLAVSKACAEALELPLYRYIGGTNAHVLPVPMMDVLTGGKEAANNMDLKGFMVMPIGAETFKKALQIGAEIFHAVGNVLKSKGLNATVGDEGGFAPELGSNADAVEVLLQAIKEAGYEAGRDVWIALDAASSALYEEGRYVLGAGEEGEKTSNGMIDFWSDWVAKYPIISIEDGLAANDRAGWKKLTQKLGEEVQLVGGDLFAANLEYLARGIKEGAANAMRITLNQVGTLTETLDACQVAHRAGYATVIAHQSGDTEDASLADLAVAVNAGQIRTGGAARGERIAKYNQLLRIEEELGSQAEFAGLEGLCGHRT